MVSEVQSPLSFSERVLTWYESHGRKHLPWQQDISPYKVWLSEVMLQQTQVATVIDYFERFMHYFPSVEHLANAPLDDVLALWAGLGYYSRAKNLHKAAIMVCEEFSGQFPENQADLEKLPGVGRSTAAAILSLAFEQPATILDGNVKRVIARHQAIEGWPGQSQTLKALWQAAESYTPNQPASARAYTQVMMDLGATVCKRSKPQCERCPVASDCKARQADLIAEIPGKKPKKSLPVKSTQMLLLRYKTKLLLEQRPLTGIWPGLFVFPQLSVDDSVPDYLRQGYNLLDDDVDITEARLPSFRHTFSHYHLDIHITEVQLHSLPQMVETSSADWFDFNKSEWPALPAPVKKIILQLQAGDEGL